MSSVWVEGRRKREYTIKLNYKKRYPITTRPYKTIISITA